VDERDFFWWRWMVLATGLVLSMGLAFILVPSAVLGLLAAVGLATGPPFADAAAARYLDFVYAVLGAVMVGWAVALLGILLGPFRRDPAGMLRVVAASLAAWYVPDTLASLWYGIWQNAVLNTLLAVVFAVPLAMLWRGLRRGGTTG
jgi:hypothetical protein